MAEHLWPWEASLEAILPPLNLRYRMIGCIATLVSKVDLLTTAHCLHFEKVKLSPSQLQLRFPGSKVASTAYDVKEIFIHPDYDKPHMQRKADIAMIRLDKPVFPSSSAQPICLDPKINLKIGESGFLISWGRLNKER